jgi:hypothetical protein
LAFTPRPYSLIGNDELQALIEEAQAEFGATDSYIGALDHDSQTALVSYSKYDGAEQGRVTGMRWGRVQGSSAQLTQGA